MRVHSIRGSMMPHPAILWIREGFLEETASANYQKENSSQFFWIWFPLSICWCLQEHTVCWALFSVMRSHQHTSCVSKKWKSVYFTWYCFPARSTGHFTYTGTSHKGILIFWGAGGYYHLQTPSLGSFHSSPYYHQNLNHFQTCMCWMSSLCNTRSNVFPCKKESRVSSGGGVLTLGML